MLKIALLGTWLIAVTVGAALGSAYLIPPAANEVEVPPDLGAEEIKAEMTSIPLIRGGEVVGYLIVQLSFQADRAILEEKKTEPLPYLNDAAFRVIFANGEVDFRRPRASDLDKLTQEIAREANSRIGADLIRQVLIQQLNYVRKEDIRTNWIGKTSQ